MSELLVLAQGASALEVLAEGVNLLWVLVVTFLIFFMHAGFAMLEAGQVRSKNVANQLTKNLLTWSVGVLAFFLVGAALSSIVGYLTGAAGAWSVAGEFAAILEPSGVNSWVDWLFGAVFAMTAATIVSGAVAGRCKLRTYVSYTVLLAAVIYPVDVGFMWGGGILATIGFRDFAGGMVVHGMGGIAGLTAAWVIGPRLGRFDENGGANVIPGHSVTFAVLGTLILAFGWFGFNVDTAATVFAADGGALSLDAFATVSRVALVTTLGMATGAIGASIVSLVRTGEVDTLYVANGLLAGLVGVTGIATTSSGPAHSRSVCLQVHNSRSSSSSWKNALTSTTCVQCSLFTCLPRFSEHWLIRSSQSERGRERDSVPCSRGSQCRPQASCSSVCGQSSQLARYSASATPRRFPPSTCAPTAVLCSTTAISNSSPQSCVRTD